MRNVIGWGVGLAVGLSLVSSAQADGENMTHIELNPGTTLVKTCGQQQLAVFDRAVAPGEQRTTSDRLELNAARLSNAQTIYVYCVTVNPSTREQIFSGGEAWENTASAGFRLSVSYPYGQLKAAFTAIGK